jgi:hypothetical protein
VTISVSFLQSATVRDIFNNKATDYAAFNWGGTSPNTFSVALFNNTLSPSPDTDPASYGVTPYNANEVTGTGWSAGGVALSGNTMTLITSVGVMFDANDVSQGSTTLTGIQGGLVYASSPTTKMGLIFVNFGATYNTSNGTFGITWDANGLARIDLTP